MFVDLEDHDLSEAQNPASPTIPRNPGILIADDMGLLLVLLKFELEMRGCAVWLAMDSDEAIDLYWRHREEIDLVLLDVQMPFLDGPETLAALRSLNPDILACFMTGDPGRYTEEDLLRRGVARVFSKPFQLAEVAQLLAVLVGSPSGPTSRAPLTKNRADAPSERNGRRAPWHRSH